MANEINSVAGQLVGIPVGQVYTAGPGIKIDNVNKVVSVDETVLWESSEGSAASSCTLSENLNNFDRINLYLADTNQKISVFTVVATTANFTFPTISPGYGPNTAAIIFRWFTVSGTSMTVSKAKQTNISFNDESTNWSASRESPLYNTIVKVVGVNRISA